LSKDTAHEGKPRGENPRAPVQRRSGTGRALVVVPVLARSQRDDAESTARSPAARLEEALGLTRAIGLEPVHHEIVNVTVARPATLIGSGKIDELAPGATQKQGSTVYQATVSFTAQDGVVPREGMAANVDVTAQRKDNVLLLPNRAIVTVTDRQYVTVKEGDTTRKVEVETGLSNSSDTEILTGVEEGQVVVIGK